MSSVVPRVATIRASVAIIIAPNPHARRRRRARRPVAVVPGAATSSAEVAELVAFLASAAGAYYSGCAFTMGAARA